MAGATDPARDFARAMELQRAGRLAEAEAIYRPLIAAGGALAVDARINLGAVLDETGRPAEALDEYRLALAAREGDPIALNNMGSTLFRLGRFAEAARQFRLALERMPDAPVIAIALGGALQRSGDLAGALACFRDLVRRRPDDADAHWNLALALLLAGDFKEGWSEYQWRWRRESFTSPRRAFEAPAWDGAPLNGRRILVHGEQGYGDTIQFARYLPMVAQRGGVVIAECQSAALVPLIETIPGVSEVCVMGGELPPFDLEAPLLSLPHIFGTELATVPNRVPYLAPPPERLAPWREKLAGDPGLKVGLVWAGKPVPDPFRSSPLRSLAPLAEVPGATLYSLQVGEEGEKAQQCRWLVDLTPGIRDFGDTAALIAALDLVISVDTSVAHLAGALGKPVWLLLPMAGDYRWLVAREDSPWYPTMRLFRQKKQGEWGEVVEGVRAALCGAALSFWERNAARRPFDGSAHYFCGALFAATGKPREATARLTKAAEILPGRWEPRYALAEALQKMGRVAEARQVLEEAVALEKAAPPLHEALGIVRQMEGDLSGAAASYREALRLDPALVKARYNLATACKDSGRFEEALEEFREVVRRAPGHGDAHWNLAVLLLISGDLPAGWREFSWRFKKGSAPPVRRFEEYPAWDGTPLAGRTLLLWGEQGAGDTLQFLRYATLCAERGGRVLVEVQSAALKEVARGVAGVAAVFAQGDELPPFDLQASLMDLPGIFGTGLATIPARIPYLAVDAARLERCRCLFRDDGTLKVGLVWRGNPAHQNDLNRSLPASALAALASLSGVSFYSLQVGGGGELPLPATDLTPAIRDYADTAALVSRLDLVISADTSVAHLTGALGVAVWLLVPFVPDWRWMAGREDSPWYPTMRLFRQEAAGDWDAVLYRVRAALAERARGGRGASEGGDDTGELTLSAVAARRGGDLARAHELFSRAALLEPERPELHNNLGVILEEMGRIEMAEASYRRALELRPEYVEVRVNLGNALLKLGRTAQAVASFLDAIALDPGRVDAYYHMGHALRRQGEWDGAVRCYRKVVELRPDHVKGWVNLTGVLLALNRSSEAIDAARAALSVDPANPDAHWNLSLALLSVGAYLEGWREYEWRLKDPGAVLAAGGWDGSPLAGRTLLVRAEQGFGDAIQFFRYAQLMARRGERVLLECRRELLPLFAAQGDDITLFASGDEPPRFDTWCYLMSLPHLMGTTLASIPAQHPPIAADRERSLSWRERLAPEEGFRVGLVWAGSASYKNDRYRSLPARELLPLSRIPGVTLYNLQLQASPEDLELLSRSAKWRDLTGDLKDFADTAALIENLDAVVSVDTAVAHLAAAMGKPVHLILPFSCDWRWLAGRGDSPWYPSVTLYRQETHGNWAPVVAAVARALSPSAADLDPNLVFREANRLRAAGDLDGAVSRYHAVLARLPDAAEVHNNLGLALQDQGACAEAEARFRHALELNPGLADACNNLGTLLVSRGEHEAALPLFRRALELAPECLPAYVNLGSCLQVLEKPEQALALYREAISRDPGFFEARINLGNAYQEMMRPRDAIATYEELLAMAPERPDGHWNLALSLLSVGEYERGWREYEWRLAGREPELPIPVWRGEELSGRTILLQCEQGLGDTLQFVRYAPLVAERGGKVVVRCQLATLKPLIARVPGVSAVLAPGEPIPPCQLQVQLASLPHLFGTTLDRMPAWRPYLIPHPRRAALWELALEAGGRLKVGLVWRGGPLPRNRACPFKEFAPLTDMDGVAFHALQLGEAPDPDILAAVDLAPQIGDFDDSAAIVAGLDLLITVDTAAAHLAGGMGAPVWLMLPYSCDWRWFQQREDSPWYPTMRIFRQERPGDWRGVLRRIRTALEENLKCR